MLYLGCFFLERLSTLSFKVLQKCLFNASFGELRAVDVHIEDTLNCIWIFFTILHLHSVFRELLNFEIVNRKS